MSNREVGKWVVETMADERWSRVSDKSFFGSGEAEQSALEYSIDKPHLLFGLNIRIRQLGFDPMGTSLGAMA